MDMKDSVFPPVLLADYEKLNADRDRLEAENAALRKKVSKYEDFLHAINYAMVACNQERVRTLLDNAFQWSYAHRVGNGEYTEEEQQSAINRAFERLTED